MDWFIAIVLGLVQGVAEWLPISSSGQSTILLVDGLNIDPATAITLGLAVHIGTAMAVVAKYPKHLLKMANPKSGPVSRFYWSTTMVSLAVGFPLFLLLEQTFESNLWTGTSITIFVGLALVITGIFLMRQKTRRARALKQAKPTDWLLLGVAQGFAVLPGISRSGMTVSALLMRGYDKKAGLQFSFLLSVPVSVAASVYLVLFSDLAGVGAGFLVLAGFIAFIFGYLTMDALVRLARGLNFAKFCIFFGGLAVVLGLILWMV